MTSNQLESARDLQAQTSNQVADPASESQPTCLRERLDRATKDFQELPQEVREIFSGRIVIK